VRDRKLYWKNRDLKRICGITLDEKKKMIIDQKYKCKSCGYNLKVLKDKDIHADHCHKTGKIRGILCKSCNISLGLLEENPERIKNLSEYAIYCKQLI